MALRPHTSSAQQQRCTYHNKEHSLTCGVNLELTAVLTWSGSQSVDAALICRAIDRRLVSSSFSASSSSHVLCLAVMGSTYSRIACSKEKTRIPPFTLVTELIRPQRPSEFQYLQWLGLSVVTPGKVTRCVAKSASTQQRRTSDKV